MAHITPDSGIASATADLAFFASLFITIGGLIETGAIGEYSQPLADVIDENELGGSTILLGASVVLSGVVDDTPYAATTAPITTSSPSTASSSPPSPPACSTAGRVVARECRSGSGTMSILRGDRAVPERVGTDSSDAQTTTEIVLLDRRNTVIGRLRFRVCRECRTGRILEIWVLDTWQRQGLGRDLVHSLLVRDVGSLSSPWSVMHPSGERVYARLAGRHQPVAARFR
ncbi:SLC13 family permease [Streptomyces sp. NPDC059679]|uniref:GNAT family N-acetyltransferase n=1 Tax=Streptomyces sp. NPDC059679 TaxID=3346903 RepID=UPI0036C7A2E2